MTDDTKKAIDKLKEILGLALVAIGALCFLGLCAYFVMSHLRPPANIVCESAGIYETCYPDDGEEVGAIP